MSPLWPYKWKNERICLSAADKHTKIFTMTYEVCCRSWKFQPVVIRWLNMTSHKSLLYFDFQVRIFSKFLEVMRSKIENRNGKRFREAATRLKIRKQPKPPMSFKSREKIPHPEMDYSWSVSINGTSSKTTDVTLNSQAYRWTKIYKKTYKTIKGNKLLVLETYEPVDIKLQGNMSAKHNTFTFHCEMQSKS